MHSYGGTYILYHCYNGDLAIVIARLLHWYLFCLVAMVYCSLTRIMYHGHRCGDRVSPAEDGWTVANDNDMYRVAALTCNVRQHNRLLLVCVQLMSAAAPIFLTVPEVGYLHHTNQIIKMNFEALWAKKRFRPNPGESLPGKVAQEADGPPLRTSSTSADHTQLDSICDAPLAQQAASSGRSSTAVSAEDDGCGTLVDVPWEKWGWGLDDRQGLVVE
jgi:hypothetical protein